MLLRYSSTRPHQSALLRKYPAFSSFIPKSLCGSKALNSPIFLKQPCRLTKSIARCSSSSSKRWQNRQGKDKFAISAKVQGLKSRAAYKLLEVNSDLPFPCIGLLTSLFRLMRDISSFEMAKLSLTWSVELFSRSKQQLKRPGLRSRFLVSGSDTLLSKISISDS